MTLVTLPLYRSLLNEHDIITESTPLHIIPQCTMSQLHDLKIPFIKEKFGSAIGTMHYLDRDYPVRYNCFSLDRVRKLNFYIDNLKELPIYFYHHIDEIPEYFYHPSGSWFDRVPNFIQVQPRNPVYWLTHCCLIGATIITEQCIIDTNKGYFVPFDSPIPSIEESLDNYHKRLRISKLQEYL